MCLEGTYAYVATKDAPTSFAVVVRHADVNRNKSRKPRRHTRKGVLQRDTRVRNA